jgi:hypothetical protein
MIFSEAENNPRRQPQIVLTCAEKACMQIVSFESQSEGTEKAIVDAAAHGGRE